MSGKELPEELPEDAFSDAAFWALAEAAGDVPSPEEPSSGQAGADEPGDASASGTPSAGPGPGGTVPDEGVNMPQTPAGVCRAIILSPIAAPAALAAGLQMVGSAAPVVQTSRGSAVYMEVPQQGDAEEDALAALLGEDRPIPQPVADMASLVSKMAAGGAVAITSWTQDGDEGTTGSIVARRFVNGKPEQNLSAGLVLAELDLVCEELLLGRMTPEEAQAYTARGRWTGWLRGPGFRP